LFKAFRMIFVTLSPVLLSLLLLAAHFYRAQNLLLAVAALLSLALLLTRKPWAARAVQVALGLGALEWLRTLAVLVQERSAMGQPWLRLALILGAVATFSALSTLVFRHPRVRARFGLQSRVPDNPAP